MEVCRRSVMEDGFEASKINEVVEENARVCNRSFDILEIPFPHQIFVHGIGHKQVRVCNASEV